MKKRLRREVGAAAQRLGRTPELLDVGGRKSPYTVGMPASVTVSDLERVSDIQHELHLGINHDIAHHHRVRRSNISGVVTDDMSATTLPSDSFDMVTSVEVIEHVDDDEAFVANISNVLRPNGVALLTTPNGDARPNPTGDHRRHYTRQQMHDLLSRHFEQVEVDYAVALSPARTRGFTSWSPRRPDRTAISMISNLVSHRESQLSRLTDPPSQTAHLIALARRPK